MSSPDAPLLVRNCSRIALPVFSDGRGSLSFAEGNRQVPFDIARVFYMYGIPPGARRGAHGHREVSLALFAVAGGFDVLLDDGTARQTVSLSQPQDGLVIGPWVWHELENFAPGTVCLALASGLYDEADYIRNLDDFRREVATRR
ncbi:MAG: FdtA/QdtA family cupin domain-containing protein [Reyranellaceae bacterium]